MTFFFVHVPFKLESLRFSEKDNKNESFYFESKSNLEFEKKKKRSSKALNECL
jgi:hypothetical protein